MRSMASALMILAVAGGTGCGTAVRPYECAVSVERVRIDPHAIWECHRGIVRRAARHKKFTLREYREAAGFFERLTGIAAPAISTGVGPLPAPGLRQTLKRWDAWYAEHRDSLVWDESRREVAVGDGARRAG